MDISTEVLQDTLIVRLQGELDLHTASMFRDEVDNILSRRRRITKVMLSLNGVTFIDSSGLGALLGRYKKIMQRGGRIVIAEMSPGVKKLLELSGVNKIIPLFDTEWEALKKLGLSAISLEQLKSNQEENRRMYTGGLFNGDK